MIDSAGEPKASFYASRRFYAPVLLSLVRAGDCVTAHLVNDRLRELRGKLTIRIERFTGEVLHEEAFDASVGENTAAEVAACSLAAAAGQERSVFLSARFDAHDGRDLAENLLFMAEPKDLLLPDPEIAMEVTAGEPCTVKLTARRFAGYVWLRRLDNRPLGRGLCEDNYFHLRAGESRTIEAPTAGGPVSAAELRNLLVVRTLYGPGS
jgi:beta-mannosidase